MSIAPDFSLRTKETLAKRAGQNCSNPDCRRPTSSSHSDNDKAVNLGEAAHIRAARQGQARYDAQMTDAERSDISNGIWLCRECARKIDLDPAKYSVELLLQWKGRHENWVTDGKPDPAIREIHVKNGGIGSMVSNEGPGIGLDLLHHGRGPAERITVEGSGVGEIITNAGVGTGKRIISSGGGSALETNVIVNRPVQQAVGMSVSVTITNCVRCKGLVTFNKAIQGFAGEKEPQVEVKCPLCGAPNVV